MRGFMPNTVAEGGVQARLARGLLRHGDNTHSSGIGPEEEGDEVPAGNGAGRGRLGLPATRFAHDRDPRSGSAR